MIFRSRTDAIVDADVSAMGSASHHRVRYSVITKMYLLPLRDVGKGPMRSHPTISKGCETVIGQRVPTF